MKVSLYTLDGKFRRANSNGFIMEFFDIEVVPQIKDRVTWKQDGTLFSAEVDSRTIDAQSHKVELWVRGIIPLTTTLERLSGG